MTVIDLKGKYTDLKKYKMNYSYRGSSLRNAVPEYKMWLKNIDNPDKVQEALKKYKEV